jgi:hypothetical protein
LASLQTLSSAKKALDPDVEEGSDGGLVVGRHGPSLPQPTEAVTGGGSDGGGLAAMMKR